MCGFLTLKLNDAQMVRMGIGIISIGNCLMPPLFGLIADHTTIAIFPYYLLGILLLMGYMHETLQKQKSTANK